MQKISGLIGKEAITLADASCRGTVLNVYFDAELTKCKYFTLASDDSDRIEWVAFKNLCSLNNDAVVIKSESCIKDCPDSGVAPSPINLPAFNQDGMLLGVIRDIELDGDKTVNIITDLKNISANTLLSMSNQLLVFNDSDQPVKLKKTAKKPAEKVFAGQKPHAVIPSPPKTLAPQKKETLTEEISDENIYPPSAAENDVYIAEKAETNIPEANENIPSKTAEAPFALPEFAFYRQAVELMSKTAETPKKEHLPSEPTKEALTLNTEKDVQKTAGIPDAPLKFPTYRQAVEFTDKTPESIKKEPHTEVFTATVPAQNTTKKGDWLSGRQVQTPAKIPPEQTSVYRSPLEENIQSRYGFLLGKRIQRPIYGSDGQILAHENALVDEKIIRRVKENGKLVMLALHSL